MTTLATYTTDTPTTGAPTSGTVRGWSLPHRRLLGLLATLIACLAIWAVLAPPALGGSTSYVITEGVSMLPHYHTADLVVLHKQPTYRVGQVAAYHNPTLRTVVMHRIVAVDGSRYVFKGDNNNFTDSYEPSASQIIGAQWFHLPGAGRWELQLQQPLVAAVLLAALWLFTFSPSVRSRRQRRRHRHAS
jgi:signal peptidase I